VTVAGNTKATASIASSALVIVATRLRRGLDELQPRYAGPIADAW
jgi:hypothetical protein